jgi:hypothetical protein
MRNTRPTILSSTRGLNVMAAAVAIAIATQPSPSRAQLLPWGWGQPAASKPAANWSPDVFADYLLTGQKPHPAVARIIAPEQSGVSMGSGVLVDANRTQGLVITNWHVIRDSRSAVLVQFPDGFQSAGTVIRWDEAWDLAALVVWRPPATPVALAAQPPAIGESLTIAGYGRGTYRAETGPCTEYLSPGTGYAKEFVELSATARQGDSGGPILNDHGELAGVLFGQNDGRTIGSCSTRLRTFLASVGSSGFTPTPLAEFSQTPALDRGIGTAAQRQPVRLVSAAMDESVQRSTHVAGPTMAPPVVAFPAAPPQAFAESGPPDLGMAAGIAAGMATGQRTAEPTVAELFDVFTNGPAILTAAGGFALAILGLRTIFGGRRAKPAESTRWKHDDDEDDDEDDDDY